MGKSSDIDSELRKHAISIHTDSLHQAVKEDDQRRTSRKRKADDVSSRNPNDLRNKKRMRETDALQRVKDKHYENHPVVHWFKKEAKQMGHDLKKKFGPTVEKAMFALSAVGTTAIGTHQFIKNAPEILLSAKETIAAWRAEAADLAEVGEAAWMGIETEAANIARYGITKASEEAFAFRNSLQETGEILRDLPAEAFGIGREIKDLTKAEAEEVLDLVSSGAEYTSNSVIHDYLSELVAAEQEAMAGMAETTIEFAPEAAWAGLELMGTLAPFGI